MKAILASMAICAIMLTGCSFKAKWHDVTSKARGEDVAKVDYDACYSEAQFPPKGSSNNATDVLNAAVSRLKTCMTDKGWELVRE